MPGHCGGQPLLSPPPHRQLRLLSVVTAAAAVATAAAAIGVGIAFVVTAATDFTPL